ncbi:MAG: SOS response-associated peptidase [Alphaproteobacteria bacterium]|nr:SOS response-associated peptidase [Alphaproteobacteria bacterium]
MCGRFSVSLKGKEVEEEFGIKNANNFIFESYNAAPSQLMPVVYMDDQKNKLLALMEWGFLAPWAKQAKDPRRPINARFETINKSRLFKPSYMRKRCFIPARGFYEWCDETSPKQPYYFYKTDQSLFAFAGLWSLWENEAGCVFSFAIITKEAEESVKPIHSRMPFVLNKENYDQWLVDAQLPDKSPSLLKHPVSLNVNSPKNNDASVIADITLIKSM